MRKMPWMIGLGVVGGGAAVLAVVFLVLVPRALELARQDKAIDVAKKHLRDTQPGQVAFGNEFDVEAVPDQENRWNVSGTLYRQNKQGLLEELPFRCTVSLDEFDEWHGGDVELGTAVVHE